MAKNVDSGIIYKRSEIGSRVNYIHKMNNHKGREADQPAQQDFFFAGGNNPAIEQGAKQRCIGKAEWQCQRVDKKINKCKLSKINLLILQFCGK